MICNPSKLQGDHCELLSGNNYTDRALRYQMPPVEEQVLQTLITLLCFYTRHAVIHNDKYICIFYVILLEKIELIINPIKSEIFDLVIHISIRYRYWGWRYDQYILKVLFYILAPKRFNE